MNTLMYVLQVKFCLLLFPCVCDCVSMRVCNCSFASLFVIIVLTYRR
jgi:hypothetical protein